MKLYTISEQGHFLASEQFTATDYINTTFQAGMQIFIDIIRSAPESEQQRIREELYDIMNHAASAFLEALIPDHMHSDQLTAQAILEAENQILDREVPSKPSLEIQMSELAHDIHEEMIKDGIVTQVKQTPDGNLIPLNRAERRKANKKGDK